MKKAIPIILLIALTLTLAACGGSNNNPGINTPGLSGDNASSGSNESSGSNKNSNSGLGGTTEQPEPPVSELPVSEPPVSEPPVSEPPVSEPQYLTLVSDGEVNAVNIGDMPQIIIGENRSTQYTWYFDLSGDGILEVVSDEYRSDPNPRNADGVGGTRTITFIANKPGETTVELGLKNHPDGAASQTVTYLVCVKGEVPTDSIQGDYEFSIMLATSLSISPGSVEDLSVGQVVCIWLEENQSIPYRWQADISNGSLIELIYDEVDMSGATSNTPGAGGEAHAFFFKALRTGECTIEMNLVYMGEGGDIADTNTYEIHIG